MSIPRELSRWHPKHCCAFNVMINLWSYARDDGTDRIVERTNEQILADCEIADVGTLRRALRECENTGFLHRIGSGPRRKFRLVHPATLAQGGAGARGSQARGAGAPRAQEPGGGGLRSPLAALQPLDLNTGSYQVEQTGSTVSASPSSAQPSPKPKAKNQVEFAQVANVWGYQDELRVWAFAQHGKTGAKAPRPLRLTAGGRKSVARALRDYGEAEVRKALLVCSQNAAETLKSLSYFDGVSNWRPANLARFVAAEPGLLAVRSSKEPQDLTKGPLFAACANKESAENEKCIRPEGPVVGEAAEMLKEILG